MLKGCIRALQPEGISICLKDDTHPLPPPHGPQTAFLSPSPRPGGLDRTWGPPTTSGTHSRGCTTSTVGFSPLQGAPLAARRGERRQPTWIDPDRNLPAPGFKARSWGVPHALSLSSTHSPRLRMQTRCKSKLGRRLDGAATPPRWARRRRVTAAHRSRLLLSRSRRGNAYGGSTC